MTFIIAEIGSSPAPIWNLPGWCEAARVVGADAIKCQLFLSEHFPKSEQASKRKLEFPRERFVEFVRCGRGQGLAAGASVFDTEAARLASLGDFIKLAAREQFNHALMARVYDLNFTGPIYRSVSDLNAIHRITFGNETTLWTVQQYPISLGRALFEVVRAAYLFKQRDMRWGWSSHSRYIADCVWAVRLGASVIEKHLAIASTDAEAGHSLLPFEFSRMVKRIRQ